MCVVSFALQILRIDLVLGSLSRPDGMRINHLRLGHNLPQRCTANDAINHVKDILALRQSQTGVRWRLGGRVLEANRRLDNRTNTDRESGCMQSNNLNKSIRSMVALSVRCWKGVSLESFIMSARTRTSVTFK